MQAALTTGLTPGLVDADKDYFAKAVTERLHEPTFNLGFTPSTDYRIDRLGVQENKDGAELIEGTYYCPGMPAVLKDATKTYVQGDDNGYFKGDDETFMFGVTRHTINRVARAAQSSAQQVNS